MSRTLTGKYWDEGEEVEEKFKGGEKFHIGTHDDQKMPGVVMKW